MTIAAAGTDVPRGSIRLADGRAFTPGKGGAGSPEWAYIDPASGGRRYIDPLPWCQMLGSLGIEREGFRHGAEFTSVTTKLTDLPTWRLVAWNGLQAAKAAAQPHSQALLARFGPEVMTRHWATAGERVRDQAGERGTLVHDIAEDQDHVLRFAAEELLEGRKLDPWFIAEANCRPYVRALQKFFQAWPGIRPIWVEVTVFNRRLGIAGTMDLIAWVPGLGLVIIDWKTSNFVLPRMSFQVAGYRYAEYGIQAGMRVPVPRTRGGFVVHLMAGDADPVTGEQDGAFELVPLDGDEDQLEIFHAMDIVGRWDHPSRIGKPLAHPDTRGLASPVHGMGEPPIVIVSPQDAVMHHLHPDTFSADVLAGKAPAPVVEPEPVKVTDVIDAAYAAFIEDQRGWFEDCSKWLMGRAQVDAEAWREVQAIVRYWNSTDVPGSDDPAFGVDPDTSPAFQTLCSMLQAACDRFEMPFEPRPVEPDWEAMRVELEASPAKATARMQHLGELLIAAGTGALDDEVTVVTLCRRGVTQSDRDWGRPADASLVEACREVADRAAALPADLVDALDAWKREVGVPNLRTISMQPAHLEQIRRRVDEYHDAWVARVRAAEQLIAETAGVPGGEHGATDDAARLEFQALTDCLLAIASSHDQLEQCTADELARITALCHGVQREDLAMGVDDDDRLVLTVRRTEMDLVACHGPSKLKARNVANVAAERFGLPRVRSTAEIAASVLLVAVMGEPVAETETPAETDEDFARRTIG